MNGRVVLQARLVVYQNGKQELCVPILASGTGIGRDPGNAVQLLTPDISKRHAFLQQTSKGWCVRDLNSRNGLFVNDKKVQEAIIKEGDRLIIGPYTLVFEIERAAQPYKPVLNIDVSESNEEQTMFFSQVTKQAEVAETT